MSGLRITNKAPNVFRFPQWKDNIFYSRDSVVAYTYAVPSLPGDSDSDSEATRLFIALRDVDPIQGVGSPLDNPTWWGSLTYTYADIVDVLKEITLTDSDLNILSNSDSDISDRVSSVELYLNSTWDYGSF